jgi:CRISPR-associated endoribonuclease Cas6
MRLNLKLSANTEAVPFSYQTNLTGAIHKWLGENEFHGAVSLYSFSSLQGGEVVGNKLGFRQGTSWFISAHNRDFIRQIVNGIFESPEIAYGIKVIEVSILEDPDLSQTECFDAASPIFIKRKMEDGHEKHFTYLDPEADALLTETLRTKLELAGIIDNDLQVSFDTSYKKAKVKLVKYRKFENRCSLCPVIIKGKPESKLLAWNVGLGNSTGIGFGAIY